MTDQESLLVLNAVPGLGSVGVEALLDYFGSPVAILQAGYEDLLQSGLVGRQVIENIIHFPKDKFLKREYNLMQRKGICVLTRADEQYPCSLKDIPGSPLVLYVKGRPDTLGLLGIAIVGSRISGYYGRKVAGEFAQTFAQAGLSVISGLARGIDTSSHKGCLKAKGRTVAVVGCGFNFVYPAENAALYDEIASQGAVATEFPMDVPPQSANFPRRNRIISGLAKALLVIEAAQKSGALITVDYALQQGKDVFAVPGPVDSASCAGSNQLIKDGAKVALSPKDVLEAVGMELRLAKAQGATADQIFLSEDEFAAAALIGTEPVHFEQFMAQGGLTLPKARQLILNLELKQVIRQLPGQYYVRI